MLAHGARPQAPARAEEEDLEDDDQKDHRHRDGRDRQERPEQPADDREVHQAGRRDEGLEGAEIGRAHV